MNEEIVYQGRFVNMKKRGRWEFASRVKVDSVAVIVAVNDQNQLILTEQFRNPVNKKVIELPAGLAGDVEEFRGELTETAAIRELFEETGYRAKSVEFLCEGPPSAGMCDEIVTLYWANDIVKEGPGGGDETEDIIVHEIDLHKVNEWLDIQFKKGILIDPKVYSGIYFAHLKLNRDSNI